MAGITVVMERKLNGFIHKEKDEQKMRKMCATQKGRHAGIHDVYGIEKQTLTWMMNNIGRKKGK